MNGGALLTADTGHCVKPTVYAGGVGSTMSDTTVAYNGDVPPPTGVQSQVAQVHDATVPVPVPAQVPQQQAEPPFHPALPPGQQQ